MKTFAVITEQLQGAPKTHEIKTFVNFNKAVHYFLEKCDALGYRTQEGDGDMVLRSAGGIGHDFRVELMEQEASI